MVVRGSVQSSFNFNQIKTKTVENLIFQLINDVSYTRFVRSSPRFLHVLNVITLFLCRTDFGHRFYL